MSKPRELGNISLLDYCDFELDEVFLCAPNIGKLIFWSVILKLDLQTLYPSKDVYFCPNFIRQKILVFRKLVSP